MTNKKTLLSQKAVLVSLNMSQWTARRLDKKITDEVNEDHGAVADAGRYNKLLIEKKYIDPITKIIGAARTYHLKVTQPWTDVGPRLLPSALVLEYQNTVRNFRHEFEAAVEKFVFEYPAAKEERRKQLNGMFRDDDYPASNDIARRFEFAVAMFNVPDVSDFRVAIGEEHVADLRRTIEESTRKCLATAMKDVHDRIVTTVGHMASKLKAYEPGSEDEKAKGVFRDSLVTNVKELCDLLPAFNLTDDEQLTAVIEKMKSKLLEHDAETLRESDNAREKVAAAADDILRDVQQFMA